jgi:hypothetical protein
MALLETIEAILFKFFFYKNRMLSFVTIVVRKHGLTGLICSNLLKLRKHPTNGEI